MKDDEEPPPDFLEYSDDEEERQARKERVIDKMVQRGAPQDQVEAKRAKLSQRGRGGRGRGEHRGGGRGRGGGHHQDERNDGNMGYNTQRFDNGLYARSTNPFYRQSRHYNPREQGQIQWHNYNVPPPSAQQHFPGYNTAGYSPQPGPSAQRHQAFSNFSVPPPLPPAFPAFQHNAWSSFLPPPP